MQTENVEAILVIERDDYFHLARYLKDLRYTESGGLDGTILAVVMGFCSTGVLSAVLAELRMLRRGVIIDGNLNALTIRTDPSLPRGSVTIRQADGSVQFIPSEGPKIDISRALKAIEEEEEQ